MNIEYITAKVTSNPRVLFLIDGIGALLSAFFLGLVFTRFESVFGMPEKALYFLALFPILFAIYDFIVYFIKSNNWILSIQIIAFANLVYSLISILLIYQNIQQLTVLAVTYFSLELLIIFSLVIIEYRTAAKLSNNRL